MAKRNQQPVVRRKIPQRQGLLPALQDIFTAAIGHHIAGRLAEAERCYRKVLSVNARHADSLHLLGVIGYQAGHYEASAKMIGDAIGLNAKEPFYHCNLGNALQALGRAEEAVACYRKALALKPEYAEAHNNLGHALQALGKLEEALACYRHALALKPDYADAYNNLGHIFLAMGKATEASEHLRRALAFRPNYPEAQMNLGNALQLQGNLQGAIACYERAISLNPVYAQAHLNQALTQLMRGDFASGWRNHEWRWRLPKVGSPRLNFVQKQWHGEPLNGLRILLHSEQGLGDCLQFLRYVPMVQAAGGTVVLEVPASVQRLAALIPGVADLIVTGQPRPAFDWHCPLMSLPLAFGTESGTIPARVPYLAIPQQAREQAAALPWPAEGLRLGLVWAGNPTHIKDRFRSIPLAQLSPLFNLKNVHLFSLQVGTGNEQLTAINSPIVDLSTGITDLVDTAAFIAQLDLVVTVDTAVAHLAGALGKPFWLLLSKDADWRWQLEREDSPWYPTARLFRQKDLGDWTGVIDCVTSALERLAAEHCSQSTLLHAECVPA